MPFARDRGLAHQLVRLRGSRQVCLRERIPGTPQPAGVRPGYKRAAGFLIPPALPCSSILCAATILERNRKEIHDMFSPSRTVFDRRPEQHNAIGYPT